ncbi:MAG: 5'-methylthioadenosine/S-adenosylhomocysteine nucleosidase [Bacilli bacterium]|nr:5'-methylthioadenosine/S-adenosylhomocysteine nucleosidase [Bacilli bacterium]
MNIGLVIAVARELKAFLESEFESEVIKHKCYEIYHFKVNGNDVYACQSGMGACDAAAVTQLLISKFDCDAILNYGVTGAVDPKIKAEDLFVVNKAVNHDLDLSPIDPVVKHQYGEFKDIFIPLDVELIKLAKKIRPDLQDVNCATGDQFIADRDAKLYLNSLGCSICDMELASIARIAWKNGVRCLSIKCISDAFDGDGSDFEKNVINAGKKAFALIKELLLNL